MNGIQLKTLKDHPRQKYVHLKTSTWCLTSKHPVQKLDQVPLYDVLLPGVLNRYFYPEDVTFHVTQNRATKLADWKALLADEERRNTTSRHDAPLTKINHFSVTQDVADDVVEDETLIDEEVDEVECDSEEDVCDDEQWVDDDDDGDALEDPMAVTDE